jgi:hypothetical protein
MAQFLLLISKLAATLQNPIEISVGSAYPRGELE